MLLHADYPNVEHHYVVKAASEHASRAKDVIVDATLDLKDFFIDSYKSLESDLNHLKTQAESSYEKNKAELEEIAKQKKEDLKYKSEKNIEHFITKLENYKEKYKKNKNKIEKEQQKQIEKNIDMITKKLEEMKKNLNN